MIFFELKDREKYASVHPAFAVALEAAAKFLENAPAEGRATIDGDVVYANVQAPYVPKTAFGVFERHCKYIDIQMVLSGEEYVDVADLAYYTETTPYTEDGDYGLGTVEKYSTLRLARGSVSVLFPEDAHRPGRGICENGEEVRKIVLKVRV